MSDPAVPLRNGKHEIIAQRLAMGDSQTQAYRVAGYRSSETNIGSDAARTLKTHPQIRRRAEYLKERMFDRQVDTKVISRHELLTALIQTAKEAASLEKPQLGVVHSCYRTIAEMEGHLVKKSEVKKLKADPFEDASPEQLANMIERATAELGFDLDRKTLDGFINSFPENASPQARADADEEAGLLQAVSETVGVSPHEGEAPATDGGESAR